MPYIPECLLTLALIGFAIVFYRIRRKLSFLSIKSRQRLWKRAPSTILTSSSLSSHSSRLIEKMDHTSMNVTVIQDINLDSHDLHNVHNLTINNNIQNYLQLLLRDEYHEKDLNIDHIIDYFQTQQRVEEITDREKILLTLHFVNKADALYSKMKIPEKFILNHIWNEIKDSNEKIKEFAYQLTDCYDVQEKRVWCLEGRIVRYLQTLKLDLVPLWYYKTEIENYCAYQLDKMVNKLTKTQQQIYFKTSTSSEEQKWIDDINNHLIAQLDQYFQEEYSPKLGKTALEKITLPCFQAIRS